MKKLSTPAGEENDAEKGCKAWKMDKKASENERQKKVTWNGYYKIMDRKWKQFEDINIVEMFYCYLNNFICTNIHIEFTDAWTGNWHGK